MIQADESQQTYYLNRYRKSVVSLVGSDKENNALELKLVILK
jgi:hypothetical protein